MYERGGLRSTRRAGSGAALDGAVEQVRAGVRELAEGSLKDLSADELRSEALVLAAALAGLQAQVFRRLAAVSRRGAVARVSGSGSLTNETAAWLRAQVGLSAGEALRWVRTAESLYPAAGLPVSAENEPAGDAP